MFLMSIRLLLPRWSTWSAARHIVSCRVTGSGRTALAQTWLSWRNSYQPTTSLQARAPTARAAQSPAGELPEVAAGRGGPFSTALDEKRV